MIGFDAGQTVEISERRLLVPLMRKVLLRKKCGSVTYEEAMFVAFVFVLSCFVVCFVSFVFLSCVYCLLLGNVLMMG